MRRKIHLHTLILKKEKKEGESIRWGFNGEIAEDTIRNKYINKSIAHTKKRGAANPIRYKI